MKKIETIICDRFDSYNQKLVYINANSLYININKLQGKFNSFVLYEGIVCTYNTDLQQTEFYSIDELNKIFSSKDYFGIRPDLDLRIIKNNHFGQFEDTEGEYWVFFNNSFQIEEKFRTTNENSNIYVVTNSDFIFIRNKIIYLKKNDNQILWQHTFSDLLQGEAIEQVGNIIVCNNHLYLCLKDGKSEKNNATFCIEVETGKVTDVYRGFYGFLFLEEGRIYTSYIYFLKGLNLNSGEIIEYNFEEILKPLNLKIHWNKSVVKDNKLYFVDFNIYSTNRMGIIDLETKQLIWQKDFEINDGINNNIQEIRVIDNRLYVHCSDNTLHIFERE